MIKNETREPEATKGSRASLCNYNMVLKSKYQALATSARRQGESWGVLGKRGLRKKKIRQGGGWRERKRRGGG